MNALAHAQPHGLAQRSFFGSVNATVVAKGREGTAPHNKTRHNKRNGALAVHHTVTVLTREAPIEVVEEIHHLDFTPAIPCEAFPGDYCEYDGIAKYLLAGDVCRTCKCPESDYPCCERCYTEMRVEGSYCQACGSEEPLPLIKAVLR